MSTAQVQDEDSDADIKSADKLADKRDKIMEKVQDDAQTMLEEAYKAGVEKDYAEIEIETDNGTWTLKREDGKNKVKYLRFQNGVDIYVISQYDPAPVKKFVHALKDYNSFVQGFNDWLDDQSDELDEVMDLVEDAEVDNQ